MKRLSIAVSILVLAAWDGGTGNARDASPRGVVLQTWDLCLAGVETDQAIQILTAAK